MNESEQQQLLQAIAALEAQRPNLGDAVVESGIAPMREKLAALKASESEQQRKLVTLLFCDVVGSTTIVQHLDPEDNLAIMDTAMTRLSAHVAAYGGRVTRYMGDGFKALFGHPVAQENDPEMAIRAGLAIVHEAGQYAAEVEERYGITGFNVRVGVSTGLVIIGGESEGEDTVVGAAVNLAARIESAATPGTVLISRDTYQHVRGIFDLEQSEPVIAKGFDQPAPVYRVVGVKERALRVRRRGVEGVETRTIGRDTELKALQDAYYLAIEDGERQMVTLTGEPGLGKSRLLYEFENWADLQPARAQLFKGGAWQELWGVPYGLLRDLFAFRFEINDDDCAQAVREKMVAGFAATLGAGDTSERNAHILGQLIGYDFRSSPHVRLILEDAQQLRDRGMMYLVEFFRAAASRSPVLILLEDLHWADDSSLDALSQMVTALGNRPILIVGAARPELYQRHPHWFEGQPFHQRLDLRALSKRESRQLVNEVLQRVDDIPDALREMIVCNAEGNPFYMEELVKILIEEGVIVKGEPYWRIESNRLAAVRVPATLTGVLQARLDSLPADERAVLQQASVVGRVFWDSVVAHLSQSSDASLPVEAVRDELEMLRSQEMVFHRDISSFAGTNEYIFKHALLRDVAYETVLKQLRRSYHGLAAAWLEQVTAGQGRSEEYAGLIADHYDLAERAAQAQVWHRRAGEHAAARFSHDEAVRRLTRALELTPEDDLGQRYALHMARERMHAQRGDRGPQAADLSSAAALAVALGDDCKQGWVTLRRGELALATGDFPTAEGLAQRAAALGSVSQDPGLEVTAAITWALSLDGQGRQAEALTSVDQGVTLARQGGLPRLEGLARSTKAFTLTHQGRWAEALAEMQAAMQVYQAEGDLPGLAEAHRTVGVALMAAGELAQAQGHLEQSLALAREMGHRSLQAFALGNLAVIQVWQGVYPSGIASAMQAISVYSEVGDRNGLAQSLAVLGWATMRMGDLPGARRRLEEAVTIAQSVTTPRFHSLALTWLGEVAWHERDYGPACSLSEEALGMTRTHGIRQFEGGALLVYAVGLEGLGQLDEAAAAFRESLDVVAFAGFAWDGRAGLARVALAQGRLEQALAEVEPILAHLAARQAKGDASHGLAHCEQPLHVYLTCYRVLMTAGDTRAADILQRGHAVLMAEAAQFEDAAERDHFLMAIPYHREMAEAYERARHGDA